MTDGNETVAQIGFEQSDIILKISQIDLKLSGFDARLSAEQANIRSERLPNHLSFDKWAKRKSEILAERTTLINEKLQLQHRLARLKIRKSEIHEQPKSHRPKCPECGGWLSEDETGIHCIQGHKFSLIQD